MNVRRMWYQDQRVHDGFHMFCHLLQAEGVGIVCVQEVSARNYSAVPVDQQYLYDGPVGSGGREAGFFIRSGLSGTPIRFVEDSVGV